MFHNGSWWQSRCNLCLDFFHGCCSGEHRFTHKASILTCVGNLVYWLGNVPQTTTESNEIPPITFCTTCAAIRRYVHPASRRPTMRPRSNGWSCSTGVRTRRRGKLVLYSKYCKYCSPLKAPYLLPVESQQVAQKYSSRAPSDAYDRDKLITNTSTPQYARTVLYPGANERSPCRCCIFSDSV